MCAVEMPRFNLVIEILFFSSIMKRARAQGLMSSFNLVIEILFFSSPIPNTDPTMKTVRFNLVIEILFFSSMQTLFDTAGISEFQSRNRDTFLFKSHNCCCCRSSLSSFNLVIEILFFSSLDEDTQEELHGIFVSIS